MVIVTTRQSSLDATTQIGYHRIKKKNSYARFGSYFEQLLRLGQTLKLLRSKQWNLRTDYDHITACFGLY